MIRFIVSEPVLFQEEKVFRDTKLYTYWIQTIPTDLTYGSGEIKVGSNWKELGDKCFLIETTDILKQYDYILM